MSLKIIISSDLILISLSSSLRKIPEAECSPDCNRVGWKSSLSLFAVSNSIESGDSKSCCYACRSSFENLLSPYKAVKIPSDLGTGHLSQLATWFTTFCL